jgi:hypothetical protein
MSNHDESSRAPEDGRKREDRIHGRTGLKRGKAIALIAAGLSIALIAGIAVIVVSWASDRSLLESGSEAQPAAPSSRNAGASAEASSAGKGAGTESLEGASPNPTSSAAGPAPAADVRQINVSFKLDPRLTKGLHMGERWVSPGTYMRSQDSNGLIVEARTQALDGQGRPVNAPAVWTSDDPGIAAASSRGGNEVEIQVYRSGTTNLTVTSGVTAKKMKVEAIEEAGHLRVAISQ